MFYKMYIINLHFFKSDYFVSLIDGLYTLNTLNTFPQLMIIMNQNAPKDIL